MKIKALKSGNFAHPDPSKGITSFEKGKTYKVDDKMAASLIDCSWAEPGKIKKLKKAKKNGN